MLRRHRKTDYISASPNLNKVYHLRNVLSNTSAVLAYVYIDGVFFRRYNYVHTDFRGGTLCGAVFREAHDQCFFNNS